MILTLFDVAERFGLPATWAGRRTAMSRLRRLETFSGRTIVAHNGRPGTGRRYVVLERELDAALNGDGRDVDAVANKIADAVQRIEQRVQDLSIRVERAERVAGGK